MDRAALLVEAWRRAFADRFLLGDPSATQADARSLLDPTRLDRRARGIDRARAEVLFEAAEQADCVAHLALVTL